MSIQEQITRISNAKTDIAAAITAKGVSVPATAKLDTLAGYVAQIDTGPLWTNPSPAATFAAQTVALSLGDYDRYLVIAATSAEETDGAVSIMAATGSSTQLRGVVFSAAGTGEVGTAVVYMEALRPVEYSGGSLVFGDATSGGEVINDHIIPLYVYGIKA